MSEKIAPEWEHVDIDRGLGGYEQNVLMALLNHLGLDVYKREKTWWGPVEFEVRQRDGHPQDRLDRLESLMRQILPHEF